jgi:hypothetical protein
VVQANRANPIASPIAVRRPAAAQAQVAILPKAIQAAIRLAVRQVNRQQVFRIRRLRAATRPSRYPAVPVVNPANRPLPALMIPVPMIRNHPNRTACQAYRVAIPRPANPIQVIPNPAIPSRANRIQAIQIRHRVNRLATVDRRRIQVFRRQATRVDRARATAIRAAVIPAIAIPKVPIVNHKAIRKASLIRTVAPTALASRNLRVKAVVNRKANPNRIQRATRKACRIRAAIPTVQADRVILAAARRARAILEAQVLLKAPPKALAIQPAIANRKAKAKIQVAIDPRTAPAIIQAIATQQVIFHQAVHPTVRRIAIPKAFRIHSHQILTHLTVVAQAHRIRSHQANRHQEVPAAVVQVHGSGHAAGSCSILIAKVQNHQRVPAVTTAR